jgi:hypothetical protein
MMCVHPILYKLHALILYVCMVMCVTQKINTKCFCLLLLLKMLIYSYTVSFRIT